MSSEDSDGWAKVIEGGPNQTLRIQFLTATKQTMTIKFVSPDGKMWSEVKEYYDPDSTLCTYCNYYRCIKPCLCDICKK